MVEIEPLADLDAAVRIPGSKSVTQRAMVIAALAEGKSRLQNVLFSEDTLCLAEALRALGAGIRIEGEEMAVAGTGGAIARPPQAIHLKNNGTAMRLLAGVASLGEGPYVLTGDARLCERPMEPLLSALSELGAEIRTEGQRGYPPLKIRGGRLRGGTVHLRDIDSSQYVSSLLIVSPFAAADTVIALEGRTPSLPYLALTLETMTAFGAVAAHDGGNRYFVRSGAAYRGRTFRIEGDASSASYFFAAAALLKGRIRVENVDPRTRQGDFGFLPILERLGCTVRRGENQVEVAGGELPGGEIVFDLGAMPDLVPTLAVLCSARPGRSLIRNVAHLRFKESDRLAALVRELRKTGIEAEELPDGLDIHGGRPNGARIETYNDHRIAMAFATLGLAAPGMRIEGEGCVAKSFPGFWKTLAGLYGKPDERVRGPGNLPEEFTPSGQPESRAGRKGAWTR